MALPSLHPDRGFVEIADRVWAARHSWLDVNVTVLAGERGLLVVDTLGSAVAAGHLADELRRLGRGEVVAVVNTHEHFDHTFGNSALRASWPDAALVAHEDAAARTAQSGERSKQAYAGTPGDPHAADVLATDILPATTTFSSVRSVDLGDRVVELVHPGRGHTAGDLVEQSAPPAYGPDSFPLDWPASLDLVLGLVGAETVVVPGHGDLVDQDFVRGQRGEVGVVAETIFDLASRSVPLADALQHDDWPFPADCLADAVRRGYDQVPRTARRLPLL